MAIALEALRAALTGVDLPAEKLAEIQALDTEPDTVDNSAEIDELKDKMAKQEETYQGMIKSMFFNPPNNQGGITNQNQDPEKTPEEKAMEAAESVTIESLFKNQEEK